LRNTIRAIRRGTISRSPGGVDVLGDAFGRIEGVNRACQQQYASEMTGQCGRSRRAEPANPKQKPSARSHFPDLRIRTALDSNATRFDGRSVPQKRPTDRNPAHSGMIQAHRSLRPCKENREADLVVVLRAVPLSVVHRCDIYLARAQLRIGN